MEQRKNPRLPQYDYTTPGAYFVTICTRDRQRLLSRIVGGDAHIAPRVELTEYGEIVEKYIRSIPEIDTYVIMPNHVHLIICIENGNGSMWASTPTQSLPQRIRSFKTLTTKAAGKSLWQRSYYDHVIRNGQDYSRIWQYITNNPAQWTEDEYYA